MWEEYLKGGAEALSIDERKARRRARLARKQFIKDLLIGAGVIALFVVCGTRAPLPY